MFSVWAVPHCLTSLQHHSAAVFHVLSLYGSPGCLSLPSSHLPLRQPALCHLDSLSNYLNKSPSKLPQVSVAAFGSKCPKHNGKKIFWTIHIHCIVYIYIHIYILYSTYLCNTFCMQNITDIYNVFVFNCVNGLDLSSCLSVSARSTGSAFYSYYCTICSTQAVHLIFNVYTQVQWR